MKLNSLAFRLFATAAAWTLIALPIVGFIIYTQISNLIMEGFDSTLRRHTWILQSEAISGTDEPARPTNLAEPLFGVTNSGWYWQVKPYRPAPEQQAPEQQAPDRPVSEQPVSGRAAAGETQSPAEVGKIYVSDSLATGRLPSPHETNTGRVEGDMRWLDTVGPLGQPLRVVELVGTISENEGAPAYLFAVAGPLDWPWERVNWFAWVLMLAFGLLGLALLLATLLQVKVALRPLSVIEKGLSAIRTGAAQRLDGSFPAEIEPLQVELNALMESNEDIIERARTQVGNLAHGLKTPLAVLTNEAEKTATPLGRMVSEQATLMNTQISHYLDRARMAARANSIGRATPVRPVALGLERALERIHLDKGVQIEVACPQELAFRGERQDLEELLGNLFDNAAKWCDRNVQVTVAAMTDAAPRRGATAQRGQVGSWLKITIEDDGPGVPAAQRAEMMQRGRRLDESKPGSGLGLAIVHDLVTSYRGQLRLADADLGGLKAELILPAVTLVQVPPD